MMRMLVIGKRWESHIFWCGALDLFLLLHSTPTTPPSLLDITNSHTPSGGRERKKAVLPTSCWGFKLQKTDVHHAELYSHTSPPTIAVFIVEEEGRSSKASPGVPLILAFDGE